MEKLILFLAQGLNVGRIPVAPGTFGSFLGLLWCGLLVAGGPWIYLIGCVVGFFVSVGCCERAEKILGQTDPGSVVIDEITAIPICFLWDILSRIGHGGAWPGLGDYLTPSGLGKVVFVMICFRFFDIVKPWPVRQSQALPGGWGVTIDDFLAAGYVNLIGLGWLAVTGSSR